MSEPTDQTYESCLFSLLAEAEAGASWEQMQSVLVHNGIEVAKLSDWLQSFSGRWLAQPDGHQMLAKQLRQLGQTAGEPLGSVALEIGQQLELGHPQEIESPAPADSALSDQIKAAESAQDFERVLALSEEYIHAYPNNAWGYYCSGKSLSNLGRHKDAIASFDRALALDPKYVKALGNRGYSLSELGHHKDAINSFDQVLPLDSKEVRAWGSRGISLNALGRYEDAIASFDQVLTLDPKNLEALFRRGKSLNALGCHEDALTSYDQALALDSELLGVWDNHGIVLSELGRHEDAIASFDQVLALDPKITGAWGNRGRSLNALGRYEDAIASYDQVLALDPKVAGAWENRGFSLIELGRYEDALTSYDQALALDPTSVYAWDDRGFSLIELGRYEDAIVSYDQALALDPTFVYAWSNRGRSLSRLGRNEDAIASFEQALTLDPKLLHAWGNRGVSLGHLGRYEDAIASYDQVLALDPKDVLAWVNRGQAAYFSPGYQPNRSSQFAVNMQLSLSQSKQQLLQTWPSPDTEGLRQSLEHTVARSAQQLQRSTPHLSQTLSEGLSLALRQFLQQPADLAPLRAFLRQPVPAEVLQQIEQDQQCQPSYTQSDLNQRGYAGELASYRAALDTAVVKADMPEGWAKLHQAIGNAHLREARQRPSSRSLWQDAASHFNRALTAPGLDTLNPKLYLTLLTELITVSTDLGEYQSAQELQRQGHDLIARLVDDKSLSPSQRRAFGLMASRFEQLSVDSFIQLQQPTAALATAEAGKRLCLRWLLDLDEVSAVDLAQLRLGEHQAIVYWHLSPNRLTTFMLLPGEPVPRVIPIAPHDDDASERPAWLQHKDDWTAWLKQWNVRYQDYIGLGKSTSRERAGHSWRDAMPEALKQLRALLNLDGIHAALSHADIRELWLLPHRDLHRFPLHGFFADYTCTYLPHLPMASRSSSSPLPLTPLLLVENPKHQVSAVAGPGGPKKVLAELPFAEVEAAFLRQLFSPQQSQTLGAQDATQDRLIAALAGDYRILHFSGHGAYDSHRPSQSCLFLSGAERLTLLDIVEQDLSSYALVTLAACETAMTGNETITDEYVGLVSACLSAGAGCVLSTLWRVESEASMVLMVEFYRHLQQGLSLAEALKRAQSFLAHAERAMLSDWFSEALSLIGDPVMQPLLRARQAKFERPGPERPFSHPYFWAPFTITTL